MKRIVNKIQRILSQVVGLLPSRLPVGIAEFDQWSDSIINTYDMPTSDRDGIKFVLATAIMHLGPTAAYKSKFYFVLLIRASAAKQIAGAKFQEIKLAQQARAAEATAQKVASDGPKQ
jgi:hypothetical protein